MSILAAEMLYGMMEEVLGLSGRVTWKMRIPEILRDDMKKEPKFHRRRLDVKKKRIHQSHCRIIGGNHKQNQRRAEKERAFKRRLYLERSRDYQG